MDHSHAGFLFLTNGSARFPLWKINLFAGGNLPGLVRKAHEGPEPAFDGGNASTCFQDV